MEFYLKVQVVFAVAGAILFLFTGRLLFLIVGFALGPVITLMISIASRGGAGLFYGSDSRSRKRTSVERELTMAEVWRQKGAYDKAVAAYGRIIELDPENVEAHIKTARILREDLCDYACALRAYYTVLRLLKDNSHHMLYIEAREGIHAIRARGR